MRKPEPVEIDIDTAVAALEAAVAARGPADVIHTMTDGGVSLHGADWSVADALTFVRAADMTMWIPGHAGHDLAAVSTAGKVVAFAVPAPAGMFPLPTTGAASVLYAGPADVDPATRIARRAAYVENELKPIIRDHGWAVQGVFGEPAFGYTIGLVDAGLPELVMVGLPIELFIPVLNHLAKRHLGATITPGVVVPAGPGPEASSLSVPLRAVAVEPAAVSEYLTFVRDVYPHHAATAVQLLWPDRDGRYPGDDGYTAGQLQFLLHDAPDDWE